MASIAATMPPGYALKAQARVPSVDILRGLVMIIMALDHVRDYFHSGALLYDPLDLSKTTVLLYFTRWITHFCAPTFAFLAGTSAFLSGLRRTKKELSVFLLKRGLFLVILEFTIVHFGWYFNFMPAESDFIVIWSLGISMIVLAGLVFLPFSVIFLVGLLLVAAHNLLDGINVPGNTLEGFGWSLLHQPGLFNYGGHTLFVGYPVIPWIGTMTLGYCFGILYTDRFEPARRKKILITLGCAAIALFIIIRYLNNYGDANHWSKQSNSVFTVLSFINTVKYPPSLLYLLMTLGPAMLFLAFSEGKPGWLSQRVSVIGRVPLFFYVLHIYLIHLFALIAAKLSGFSWSDMILNSWIQFEPQLKGYGFALWLTYVIWAAVILMLYPLCKWYDNYKRTHKGKWWLSYI